MSRVYDAVVVGTDGSPTSCRAVQRAALLGEALGAEVAVVTAYYRPSEGEVGPASERASMPQESMVSSGYRAATDTAADAARFGQEVAPSAKVDIVAVEGNPAEVLIETAYRRGDALLVVGNQGMTGSQRFLLGSVPNKISHHAAGDVLITHTSSDTPVRPHQRVLIGTDGSDTAKLAVDRGLSLAAALEAKVTLLSAGSRAEGVLEEAAEAAKKAGVDVTCVASSDEPADAIVSAAEDHDLVVVGNKGMTGAGRFLLGSVPNKVSHHVGADLLIVRTT